MTNCYNKAAIEELAVEEVCGGKPDEPLRLHMDSCQKCAASYAQAIEEARAIREALTLCSSTAVDTPCPDVETIALFVDHSLDGSQQRKLRKHLSNCRTCQVTAIQIRKNLDDLLDVSLKTSELPVPISPHRKTDAQRNESNDETNAAKSDDILPEQGKVPATLDDEERKGRYSSKKS